MAFDGIAYVDAEPGSQNLYYPHAPLVGPSLSKVLRIAYLVAHRHGRKIIDQHAAFDFRPDSGAFGRQAMAVTDYRRIAEGFRYIPDRATHLVGEARYSLVGRGDVVRVRHRLVVVGAGTDTGVVSEDVFAPEDYTPTAAADPIAYLDRDYSVHAPANTEVSTFEVELSNAPAGAVSEVYVEAYAVDVDSGTAASYVMQHVGVQWEIRA